MVFINGIMVYKIKKLIDQKLDAGQNRSKVRDLFDLNYLTDNFKHDFSEHQKKRLVAFAKDPDNLVSRYRQNHGEDNILKEKSLDDLALNLHLNSELMREKNPSIPLSLADKFSQEKFNHAGDRERFLSEVSKQLDESKNQLSSDEKLLLILLGDN